MNIESIVKETNRTFLLDALKKQHYVVDESVADYDKLTSALWDTVIESLLSDSTQETLVTSDDLFSKIK